MNRGTWQATVRGAVKSQTQLTDDARTQGYRVSLKTLGISF